MNGAETVLTVLWWLVGAAFSIGALLAVWRIVRGPTIVDRMVASDTLLTIMICVLGADMVMNGHTNTLVLMLVLAMTAFIASVAVARYVSRQGRVSETFQRSAIATGSSPDGPLHNHDGMREAELRESQALDDEMHRAETGEIETVDGRHDHDPTDGGTSAGPTEPHRAGEGDEPR